MVAVSGNPYLEKEAYDPWVLTAYPGLRVRFGTQIVICRTDIPCVDGTGSREFAKGYLGEVIVQREAGSYMLLKVSCRYPGRLWQELKDRGVVNGRYPGKILNNLGPDMRYPILILKGSDDEQALSGDRSGSC